MLLSSLYIIACIPQRSFDFIPLFTDCCIWDVSFRSLWQESKYSAKHTGKTKKKNQDESKNSFARICKGNEH